METKITKFSQISNKIFLAVSIYMLTFVWLEFRLHSLKSALLLSTPITLVLLIIFFYISKIRAKKKEKLSLRAKDKEHLLNQIIWGNATCINKFILEIFGYEKIEKISSSCYENDDLSIHFCFNKEILDNYQLANIARNTTKQSIMIFCITSSINVQPDDKEICIIDLNKLYQILGEKASQLPTNINIKNKAKYRLKDVLCIVLNKGRSRGYLMSAILLIFLSLFTPYNIYYIISSTILLLLSIYSRFNLKFN